MNLLCFQKAFQKIFRLIIASVFCAIVFFVPSFESPLMAQTSFSERSTEVVEVIRLSVPKSSRQAWLKAEMGSWDPWLAKKNGFLGRQLFWDPNTEEASLLISWSSKNEWKSIAKNDLDKVQSRFEEIARLATGQDFGNPFPINSEGELLPQP